MSSYQGNYPFEFKRHKKSIVMLILILVGLIFDAFQSDIFSVFSGQNQAANQGQLSNFLGNLSQGNSTVNQGRFLGIWKNTTNGVDTSFTFTNDTLLVASSSQIQYYTYEVLDEKTFMITSSDGQSENSSYEFASGSALLINYHGSLLDLIKVG
jgi:hypothetical protein